MTIRLSDYLITNKTSQDKLYTAESISAHNNKKDCYVGLSGKVYDISKYSSFLKNNGNNRQLNVICGSLLDINPSIIFKMDNYDKYEVGVIQYYLLKKMIKVIVLFILYIISIYYSFVVKSSFSIICVMYLIIISYIIIRWLLKKYSYISSVNVKIKSLL